MTDTTKSEGIKKFQRYALWLLVYTLLVIVWGAWVRISQSGDGCGDHWPLCNGQFIPGTNTFIPAKKTWVEYTHRLMSGAFGLIVFWIFWRARKLFQQNHPARRAATASLIFMITEALLGAKLVLFGLVMKNDSPLRTFAMSLHMINSLMLVGSITLLWSLAFENPGHWRETLDGIKFQKSWAKRRIIGVTIIFAFLATSGAIAALASTLFPSESLLDGLNQDLSSSSHYLIRLRILHPILGILVGSGLGGLAWFYSEGLKASTELSLAAKRLSQVCFVAVPFGIITLLSLAPEWMKLTHLLLAHSLWISLVLVMKNVLWQQSTGFSSK